MIAILRVDDGAAIGLGHFMRCLALAQGLRRKGHQSLFVSRRGCEPMLSRLKMEGFEIVPVDEGLSLKADAVRTMEIGRSVRAHWIILDGYHFGTEYQRRIISGGSKVCSIDDIAECHFLSHVVVNQNLGAESLLTYSHDSHSLLLLGSKYVLLRDEFLNLKRPDREFTAPAKNILVTMGGSDPDNQTLKVIHSLQRLSDLSIDVKVVIGGSNPHAQSFDQAVLAVSYPAEMLRDVTDMPRLMTWADLAICAGGSTNWEMAYLGLPSIILVLSENQQIVADQLHQRGSSINLGWWEEVDEQRIENTVRALITQPEKCRRMSQCGWPIVDGRGADRVIEALENITSSAPERL